MIESLISHYEKRQGKIPIEPEETRKKYQNPPDGDYCAVFKPRTVVLADFDDYDHSTGQLDEPIHNHPRSEAVIQYLDKFEYKYNGIRTENGVHLEFLPPSDFQIEGNKNNWICPLGIKLEIKVTKPVELCVVNGIKRQCFKGSIGSPDIDPLPPALYPIQKSREKPFLIDFPQGDRNNALSAYALHLPSIGISAEESAKIIKGINEFILEDPLPEEEINLILRPETLDKMKKNQDLQKEKNLSHATIGQEIIDKFGITTVQGQMYYYDHGVYRPVDEDFLGSYIRKLHPSVKTSMKNEAIDYIKDMTFMESWQEEKHLINVKNGLLNVLPDGTVLLQPHSKEVISFRQFHAEYHPETTSGLLNTTLSKFFDSDQEQMRLFRQMLGYLLMNHTKYQKCFFFVGSPSSGKSKIMNMITNFCGKENVSNLTLKELDDRFRASSIVGKTANINADLESAKIIASGTFKSLCTGDAIVLEQKFKKPFSHVNTAKIIFATNSTPDFSKDPEGIMRRMIIFPCNHVFSKNDPDFNPNIDEDLFSDEVMSALLCMALTGYSDLTKNHGFISTKACERASEGFRCSLSSVYQWIKETDQEPQKLLQIPIKAGMDGLYMDYCSWCITAGETAKSQRDFSKDICSEYHFQTTTKRFQGKCCQFFTEKS